MKMTVKTDDLTPRQGKVLRYVVSCKTPPVKPAMCVNQIEWSDLPHDNLQAKASLEKLRKLGLAEKQDGGYVPTAEGTSLIREATENGIWQS
jgi:hypothetical protein